MVDEDDWDTDVDAVRCLGGLRKGLTDEGMRGVE